MGYPLYLSFVNFPLIPVNPTNIYLAGFSILDPYFFLAELWPIFGSVLFPSAGIWFLNVLHLEIVESWFSFPHVPILYILTLRMNFALVPGPRELFVCHLWCETRIVVEAKIFKKVCEPSLSEIPFCISPVRSAFDQVCVYKSCLCFKRLFFSSKGNAIKVLTGL